MVISNTNAANAAQQQQQQLQQQQQQQQGSTGNGLGFEAGDNSNNNLSLAHPSGIPQDQIDNILSGIEHTGNVRMNNHRKKLKQRFDIIKKLGQGTYGKVQLGINKETGQEVAIKTIKKCKIEAEADLVRIRREVQIMSSVQHPNIIHIYEVFENREKMVLVMEFAAGGELYDYLSERKVLSEEEARRIFRQVATAVYYCHKHKICHRDLKLENILLDEKGNAKIADFGLSNVFDDQRLLQTFCGSPLYASPEIVEGTPYQGPEVDCWSLGVLLYTLVYGSMPFDGSNFKRLVKQISQGDYYEPKQPSRASSLIRAMLTVCPTKRATIEQICSHWWVNENNNVLCLDLAEDLANQTPVRLDVLLSVTPSAITADQLVVPSADGKQTERIARSHSDGSIREISAPATEAEQRIIDMVAAGGEAALMPSPTRTITPAQSPVQSKRKLETTISTDNAVGFKKKEKPSTSALKLDDLIPQTVSEDNEDIPMDVEGGEQPVIEKVPASAASPSQVAPQEFEQISQICDKLLDENKQPKDTQQEMEKLKDFVPKKSASLIKQKTEAKLDPASTAAVTSAGSSQVPEEPIKEEKEAAKVIKKFVNKHKTADLVNAIGQVTSGSGLLNTEKPSEQQQTSASKNSSMPTAPPFVRKCSLQDESTLNKFQNERRKSRILETAEKFQQMNNSIAPPSAPAAAVTEKGKKIVIPGVSVGSFKKEFERKAVAPGASTGLTAGEKRALEEVAQAKAAALESETSSLTTATNVPTTPPSPSNANTSSNVENSDSKSSVTSITLEEARRSMENSIALLRQAQNESSKEVDQLCAKTADIGVSDTPNEREQKLKAARAIIGNVIQPVLRRTPIPVLFGINGGGYGLERDDSGSVMNYFSSLPYLNRKPPVQENANNSMCNVSQHNTLTNFRPVPFNPNPTRMFSPIQIPATSLPIIQDHKNFQQEQQQPYYTQTQSEPPTPTDVHQYNHSKNVNPIFNNALAAARQNIINRLSGATSTGYPETIPSSSQAFKPTKTKPSKIDEHLKHFNSLSQGNVQNSQQPKQSHQTNLPDNFPLLQRSRPPMQIQNQVPHESQPYQNFQKTNNASYAYNEASTRDPSSKLGFLISSSSLSTTVTPTSTNSRPFNNATVATTSNKATSATVANRINYLNSNNNNNNHNNNTTTVPNNLNNKINNNNMLNMNMNLNSTPKPFYNASTQSQNTQNNYLATLAYYFFSISGFIFNFMKDL